jgi:hypothetical protein
VIVVGCPVRGRKWILTAWRDAVYRALDGEEFSFHFVMGPDDQETFDLLRSWENVTISFVEEPVYREHKWTPERYEHMAMLRNTLLRGVRRDNPDYFLSLDSDILLNARAFKGMKEVAEDMHPEAWAVGGQALMGGYDRPSHGFWTSGERAGFVRRPKADGVMKVDVIMAVKLMRPVAYNIDYVFHPKGEDIGWSAQVAERGGGLWWDGRFSSAHFMTEQSFARAS